MAQAWLPWFAPAPVRGAGAGGQLGQVVSEQAPRFGRTADLSNRPTSAMKCKFGRYPTPKHPLRRAILALERRLPNFGTDLAL